jgi:transcriptional regulator with XRE-family HTH domain
MPAVSLKQLGRSIRAARTVLGLTQEQLGSAVGLSRYSLLRLEAGEYMPALDEAVRLAGVLKVPLGWLTTGRIHPPLSGASSVAYELHRLGVRDLVLDRARVPGAFRNSEEVLIEAVDGDRPNPRVVEAIPFVLTRAPLNTEILFAMLWYGRRAQSVRRLGWLVQVTLSLTDVGDFPRFETARDTDLAVFASTAFWASGEMGDLKQPDSLGHPDETNLPPIWRQWNVTYAGRPADFIRRAAELTEAVLNNPVVPEGGA